MLCADGSGEATNTPPSVWNFEVSGYRVLSRWLAARQGRETDEELQKDMRDVAGRIAELIDLFAHADSILIQTLDDPLSRDSLDLAAREAASADDEWTCSEIRSVPLGSACSARARTDCKGRGRSRSITSRAREKLNRVLAKAKAASTMPWGERNARMWQTVFPQMANWLPEDEANQLRLEFKHEIERLKAA